MIAMIAGVAGRKYDARCDCWDGEPSTPAVTQNSPFIKLALGLALLGNSGDSSVKNVKCERYVLVNEFSQPCIFDSICPSDEEPVRNRFGRIGYCGLEAGNKKCPMGTECTSNETGDYYVCCPIAPEARQLAQPLNSRFDGVNGIIGGTLIGPRYVLECGARRH